MTASRLSVPLDMIRSMRPLQWFKNLLLFAGIIFSQNFRDVLLLQRAIVAFVLFCILSGAVYILNDLVDLEADRQHPVKRRRPLAAGRVSPGLALITALIAAVVALAGSFLLSLDFGLAAVTYFLITCLYSLVFKHVAIIDVILLAMGFVLRAIAGVLAIRVEAGPYVPMTPWFVICVLFLALFVAICKRRGELITFRDAPNHRRVLQEYSPEFLDQMIAVSTSATVIAYALYLIAGIPGAQAAPEQDLRMIATLPFVIYGIFRYLYLVYHCSEGSEPEKLIIKDKPLLLNVVLWVLIMVTLRQ